MSERVKFLNEVSKTEKKDDVIQRSITEDDYRKYMKKFYGFDKKLLAELKKAKEEFYTDLIKLTGNDLLENENANASEVKVRTEAGRVVVKFEREKQFQNPSTGEPFKKPSVSMKINVKSYIDKSVLAELENEIKKAL